jgi:hypothetical protein
MLFQMAFLFNRSRQMPAAEELRRERNRRGEERYQARHFGEHNTLSRSGCGRMSGWRARAALERQDDRDDDEPDQSDGILMSATAPVTRAQGCLAPPLLTIWLDVLFSPFLPRFTNLLVDFHLPDQFLDSPAQG